jgi:hypothetical protein
MIDVYLIKIDPCGSNAYGVSRSEDWQSEKIRSFDTIKEAKEFVKEKSHSLPDFVRLAEGLTGTERDKFLEQFCFSNQYAFYNRYVVGEEGLKNFIKSVKKNVPHVIM